jgi:hypothetical protein
MGDHISANRVLMAFPVPNRLGKINLRERVTWRRMEDKNAISKDLNTGNSSREFSQTRRDGTRSISSALFQLRTSCSKKICHAEELKTLVE